MRIEVSIRDTVTRVTITLLLVTLVFSLSGSQSRTEDYWQQWVHYRMDVHLDPDDHLLTGNSTITYVNNSPDTLHRVYLHLYPNAFQEGSVKHREFQRVHYSGGISEDNPSYLKILEFRIEGRNGPVASDFDIDDTILSSALSSPMLPGDSVVLDITWEHKVRERAGRMGYAGEQYDFAQWYPKMVVYDETGWHNVPFHAIGEFYGEFGNYDVTIDVPERYIVGATGVVVEGDPGWDSVSVDTSIEFSEWEASLDSMEPDSVARRIVTFHGESIHDFAWITSPTFVYEYGNWNGIDIHVLYNRTVGEKWTRVVRERSERAMEWLSTNYGPYPYPQVTVTHAMRGGGMEYPMLVMNGNESEGLILHEIGHIWFYGILANDEVDEAWLDEGFTSFQTRQYLENRYPPYGYDVEGSDRYSAFQKRFWKFNPSVEISQWSSIRFMTSRHNRPIATKSYHEQGYNAYRQNAYTKPSHMLRSLQSVLGKDLFDEAMKTYYARWKLKHTNEERFRAVVEEVSGQDLAWFFDAWLHTTFYCDYALKGWEKRRLEDGRYEVTVKIVNKGDMFFPLTIQVDLADGDTFRTRWTDFLWRWEGDAVFTVPSRPKRVILDPDNESLDVNLLNNRSGLPPHTVIFDLPGSPLEPRDSYVVRWNPILWYHEKDGVKPGLSLTKSYGPWSRVTLSATAGVESGNIHGEGMIWRRLISMPSVDISARGYALEGVRGTALNLRHRWSRYYWYPPYHSVDLGLYITDAHDSTYTDLYDEGTVTVLYGKYGVRGDMGQYGGRFELEISSAPGGLGDWTFGRIRSQMNVHGTFSRIDFGLRLVAGHTAAGSGGVPVQEKFTVSGGGSGVYFSKPYLRHPSSFYSLEDVRNRFHLYGDANLRGYYDHGFEGAESVATLTVEASRSLPVPVVHVKFRAFLDGGWIWSEVDDLEGSLLANSGFGLALRKRVVGADLRFRIDLPFWVSRTEGRVPDDIRQIDFSRWVVGFETGIP